VRARAASSLIFPLGLSLALTQAVRPAAAQTREPEAQAYSFVSELGGPAALWVNPGAAHFDRPSRLSGHISVDRPEDGDWSLGQYMLGVQAGYVSFGYRHDEFDMPGGYSQGDAYRIVVGLAARAVGLGVSRTWQTVGEADSSWELGWLYASASGLTAGLVWRDIGSPAVRDTVQYERLIGAFTFRPRRGPFAISLQADYRPDGGEFRAFRVGGRFAFLELLDGFALAEWDGAGDFEGFRIGLMLRHQTATATAAAGLDAAGDARTASAGLALDSPHRR
jgi:hypothetical protein